MVLATIFHPHKMEQGCLSSLLQEGKDTSGGIAFKKEQSQNKIPSTIYLTELKQIPGLVLSLT